MVYVAQKLARRVVIYARPVVIRVVDKHCSLRAYYILLQVQDGFVQYHFLYFYPSFYTVIAITF